MVQEVALLVSQYLSSRSYGHIAKIIEEQILERTGSQYEEEVRDVEQAIHGENAFRPMEQASGEWYPLRATMTL